MIALISVLIGFVIGVGILISLEFKEAEKTRKFNRLMRAARKASQDGDEELFKRIIGEAQKYV